ncbi:FAD-binding oxidoreductase [Pseudarthrobacter sp. NPDC058329]|uniref:FAD-binding oxidoreductase n=1 Tax=Pseudarthrobacter sp. NPDC058329 TaxID=3346448 RepID=UPI0036D87E91
MTQLRRLVFWSVTVLFPLPLVIVYWVLAREPEQLKFFVTLGLVAYAWWLLSVLLSVRPVWLERVVGLPVIYGLHGMLGVLAIVLAFVHRDNSYSGEQLAVLLGDWGFYAALAVLCYSVFFLSGWLVDRVRLLHTVKRWLEKVFRHQVSVWVHRLNLVIIAMIWLHAHLLVRVNQYFWFMMLFDLYTLAVLATYAWKKWVAPDGYATGAVTANTPLGESSRRISIRLDQPENRLRPGDFFFLRFEGSPAIGREWHPFSVTDANQETVTFTIRQHGNYTRRLAGVPVGTRARLEGPFGRFESTVQRHDADAPLVLLGMGAGIAPLLSLAAAHHTTRPLRVLWAVRETDHAYYRDLLEQYRSASDGKTHVTIQVGRFRREHLTGLLTPETIAKGAFFIVGPNPAVLATQSLLRHLGVSQRRIHQERLTM